MEDKREREIREQATASLIQGKTEPTIEEAIENALRSEDARPPMRIARGENNGLFQLQLQRNRNYSTGDHLLFLEMSIEYVLLLITGGTYRQLTRTQIAAIVAEYFASRQNAFANWTTSNDDEPFPL